MSFKSNGKKRDSKKMLSALMCLIFAIVFIASIFTHGFSITKLSFGIICFYLSTAFFRISNEY